MTEAKKQEFVDASREKFLLFNNGRHRIGGICPYALVSYSREKVGASQTFIVISFATSLDFAKKKRDEIIARGWKFPVVIVSVARTFAMCLDEDKQQEFITKCIDAHYSDVYDTKSIPMSAVVDAKISVTDNAEEDSKEEKVVGNADSKDEKVIGANTEEETTILRDRSNFHDGDNKVYHSTKKRYQNSVIAYIGNSKVGYSMTVYGHFRCDEEARDACAKLSNIHDITFYVIYTGRCVQIPAPYMPEITHQTDKSVEPVLNKMKMKKF